MGFSEGQIILDSPTGSYSPGQTIFGKLIFQEDKARTFKGIYIKFKGFCKVQWSTSHRRTVNGETKTVHEHHSSEEEYVNVKVYLLGGESGECTIQPGKYELPFQCQIPHICPSSFEGSKGHIRYQIKAVVDRAFKLDLEKMVAVRLVTPIDLNTDPYCKDPLHMEFSDTFCCCCISYGHAETVMKLPVAGYCPGQVIPIEIGCENKGSVEISEIKFFIEKVTKFKAINNPSEESETEKFSKTKTGPVAADTTRTWTVNVEVPRIEVVNVAACRFIDIEYFLKVVLCPTGCHSNSDGSRRIIIGTVPLVPSDSQAQSYIPVQSMPVTNQPLVNVTPYPSEPPPYNVSAYPTNTPTYPSNANTGYPSPNPNYPPGNLPYPGNAPYPSGNSPYPSANPPYPTSNSPFAAVNTFTNTSPYPPPYSGDNLPYPTVTPYPPASSTYPTSNTGTPLKTGTLGFTVQSPGTPAAPYPAAISPNPYASASAPVVDTLPKQ